MAARWSKGQRVVVLANPGYPGDTSQRHIGQAGEVLDTHDYPRVQLDNGFLCLCCHPDSLALPQDGPETPQAVPAEPYLPNPQDQLTLGW